MIFEETVLNELTERQSRNPSYSMRSFARSVGVSPSLLSQILSGTRKVTYQSAVKIIEGLNLEPNRASMIMQEVSKSKETGKWPQEKKNCRSLSSDEFAAISDWEHYAILALAGIRENQKSPTWVAKRLNISEKKAADAMKRLKRLGFIKFEGSRFRQTDSKLDTRPDVPSVAVRKYHRQNLEKAIDSLNTDPVDIRYFGSITVAINPEDIPKFKALLRSFRKRFDAVAEKSLPKQVYHFSTHLFPVDQGGHT